MKNDGYIGCLNCRWANIGPGVIKEDVANAGLKVEASFSCKRGHLDDVRRHMARGTAPTCMDWKGIGKKWE